MGHADCIGQNRWKMGYIFAMRFCRRIVPRILGTLAFATVALRADPGDVESSRDYAGFPRPPGFVITDYDEDNPAEFDFPVAQPLPTDADHVATLHVKGHRYVIRYELSPGNRAPSLFQTQRYYEKLASDAGFTVEKTGAVADVTETFRRAAGTHETWVYLEPAVTANVLTIVESIGGPSPLPRIVAVPPATPEAVRALLAPTPPAPFAPPIDPNDDSLYTDLSESGRVVVPFVFQPGKDELDDSSQPLVDRVVAMMKRHPDLFLRIEGHTDNLGDPDDNLRLSAQRALAVQAMLIAADIDPKRLDAVGVGGLQPLADNNTAEGREKNRRIELVMWQKYPAFHAPAPNGANYYPGGGSSPGPSPTGL
jgi:outer membrane protein OmpA-like peptidoglycan-associated protein